MSFWKPGTSAPSSSKAPAATPKKNGKIVEFKSASQKSGEKVVLSKSVMSMKFMKRKEEAVVQEKAEQLKYEQISDSNWIAEDNSTTMDVDAVDDGPLQCIKDNANTFSALPGRRSFGGFNKAVEKHYQQVIDHKRFQRTVLPESMVDEEEMLQRYDNLVSLPRGPNQGLRQESKPTTKLGHGHAASSSSGAGGESAPHRSKNKSLIVSNGGGSGHKGATMEEVVHFVDRVGAGDGASSKNKHAGDKGSKMEQNKRKGDQANSGAVGGGNKKMKFNK